MTKVTREDSMTKVIQSFQSSDLQPLNARLLRGEVDPWETLPLNNPPFRWPLQTQLLQNNVFPQVFRRFMGKLCFYHSPRGKPLYRRWPFGTPRGDTKID